MSIPPTVPIATEAPRRSQPQLVASAPPDARRDPSPRSCDSTGPSMTEAERRAVDVLITADPHRGDLRWYLRDVRELVADPEPLATRTKLERDILAAYLAGENARIAREAADAFRARRQPFGATPQMAAVQRERAAQLDPLDASAIWLKSVLGDTSLDECKRLVVGVLTVFHKSESEACRG